MAPSRQQLRPVLRHLRLLLRLPLVRHRPALAAIIQMGPISMVNGRVLFSDRFIQPNYTANLTDLTGKLSRFSNQPTGGVVQLADLELRGRAEGTASLEILGKLNPLAQPLALDVKGLVPTIWSCRLCRHTRSSTPATASSAAS